MNKQKKERREEFITAAKDIINTQGYEACTVRSICQRVGVAPSSFYHCFEDKDEVIFMIAMQVDPFFEENEDRFTLDTPRENLALFMQLYFERVEQDGFEYNWRFHMQQRGDRRHITQQADRAVFRILNRIIYQGRDLLYGDLKEDEVFNLIMTMLRGQTFDWARNEGAYSLSEWGKKHIPAYVRAIFKPSSHTHL